MRTEAQRGFAQVARLLHLPKTQPMMSKLTYYTAHCTQATPVFAACFGVLLATLGCSGSPQATTYRFNPPAEISHDGKVWRQRAWSDDVDKRLQAYFRQNPLAADNPGFAGEAILYVDDGGTERCYWLTPVEGACQWLLVEFRGSRGGAVVVGAGAPFEDAAIAE